MYMYICYNIILHDQTSIEANTFFLNGKGHLLFTDRSYYEYQINYFVANLYQSYDG